MRPVSDRLAPFRVAPVGPRAPYAERAYGDAHRAVARPAGGEPDARERASTSAAADAQARMLLAAQHAPAGVESEVAIRVYADGGSISVVRHLRGGRTVGIEALIR